MFKSLYKNIKNTKILKLKAQKSVLIRTDTQTTQMIKFNKQM